jgi:hypothetical protein
MDYFIELLRKDTVSLNPGLRSPNNYLILCFGVWGFLEKWFLLGLVILNQFFIDLTRTSDSQWMQECFLVVISCSTDLLLKIGTLLPEMNAHEKSMDYFIELLRKDTVSFILLIRFRKTLLSIEKKQEWLTISPRGNTLASTGCRKSLLTNCIWCMNEKYLHKPWT